MRILIIGGGVAGLATALSLSRAGHAVQVLERDATPLPASPVEAFESWERSGAPQVWHSHAFLARLRNGLVARTPDVLEALHAHGADDLRFARLPAAHASTDRTPHPGDERAHALRVPPHHLRVGAAPARAGEPRRLVARRRRGRRPRRRARRRDGSAARHGRARAASAASRARFSRGSRARRERSPLATAALARASSARPKSRRKRRSAGSSTARASTSCGRAPVAPAGQGVVGADLGYMKFGIFPGDSGIFSITLAASLDDDPLRAILHEGPFEAAARALPATREWIEPARSEPVTEVRAMAKLVQPPPPLRPRRRAARARRLRDRRRRDLLEPALRPWLRARLRPQLGVRRRAARARGRSARPRARLRRGDAPRDRAVVPRRARSGSRVARSGGGAAAEARSESQPSAVHRARSPGQRRRPQGVPALGVPRRLDPGAAHRHRRGARLHARLQPARAAGRLHEGPGRDRARARGLARARPARSRSSCRVRSAPRWSNCSRERPEPAAPFRLAVSQLAP